MNLQFRRCECDIQVAHNSSAQFDNDQCIKPTIQSELDGKTALN
jgi:hypothetical protein